MSHSAAYIRERRLYLAGIASALILSAIPFALVAFSNFARLTILIIVVVCAVIQVVVHFRCFLHIDFKRQNRDDLQLILFSTMIVILMVSGTIWIISNQIGMMM